MERETRVEMIDIDRIKPNPYQPREAFPKESIQQLANSIKHVGLLQPISVRPVKGKGIYEVIAGERRWRAAKLAGLKRVPAIVKDVDDARMMMESLIENVHREDLAPIERARGLAEVYRLAGFEPAKAMGTLATLDRYERERLERRLSEVELRIKEIADMVDLSYDYQYRLLSSLRLTPEEQKRVTELGLGYEEISSIATIEKPEVRKKVIEIAPELERAKVKKVSKIVKKAPEPLVKAVVKREIEPEVAEYLLEVPEEKLPKAIKDVKALRLKPEEVEEYVKTLKVEVPKIPPERLAEVLKDYEKLRSELRERMETPEMKELGRLVRNLSAHLYMSGALNYVYCPICGADWRNLVWKCHNLNIKESIDKLREQTKKGGPK
jgi:ParB family chromosome partitioning protein